MRVICSEISAQNWGTIELRLFSACCFSSGSGSVRSASTPAAEDCKRTIEVVCTEAAAASCSCTEETRQCNLSARATYDVSSPRPFATSRLLPYFSLH